MSLYTPTAYYKLDEASGNASDSTGNGNTLTNIGSISYVTGKINNGASNNGSGTKRLSGSLAGFNASSSNTWSFWYKPDGHVGYILDHNGASGNVRCIVYNDGNGARLFANGNEVDGGAMTLGQMYFIVVTKSGTNWELFVDNVSKGTTTTGGLSYPNDSTFSLLNANDSGGAPMNGVCDEAGYWPEVLGSTDRGTLFNSGNGLSFPFVSDEINASLLCAIV